ncbi:NAD(P)-binding protein [Melanomma pulvis-pyrius CBS 109.77]|uniref:NAD(P)-binding protein n=1 Tax=Melanomma pulvis-pyrius CBS 109.77 TaxID=1314802 RepID=A0A6A6XGQ4_9PLEO|nr:NAD(P)-binding protein [Melanomma pulvis-pyrius CBS 109.77]
MPSTSDLPSTFYCTKSIDFSKAVDSSTLKDKSVIVTGGANGLGAGCVTAFAEAGAYITVLDINEENGNALASALTEKGYHVQFTKIDATSFASQTAGFKSAISFSPHSTLDLVLCAAGLTGLGMNAWLEKVSKTPDADPSPPSTATIDVNLTGLFYSAHLSLYYFKQTAKLGDKSSKHLIFVSSLAGYVALDKVADYNASKFGVRGMWKAIRNANGILGEEGPGFRTNLVAPTFIRTQMTAAIEPGLLAMGISLGEIEDVTAGVMRLACDESISGRAIAIAAREKMAGDRNFDLGDDWEGLDAGRETLDKIRDGTLHSLELVGGGQGNKYDRGNMFRGEDGNVIS